MSSTSSWLRHGGRSSDDTIGLPWNDTKDGDAQLKHARLTHVALLLFGSGLCALVYQVAWLRLLRLVFGSSTAATSAVLAIFMAGLGAGSLILGRRADQRQRPLAFYAQLEIGVALAAAASPLLIGLVRSVYLGLGGTTALGAVPGTLLRLVLSTLVLGLPTFLMGGTLPAMARAVERSSDAPRRFVALLYGANTLGAVCGALLTTFVAIEWLGVQKTIWAAAALNLAVALAAYALARFLGTPAASTADDEESSERTGPLPFLLGASAAVGFAFLVMELVWYRMLSPVLGGSSYTFGLILAVALLGVGVGGLLYGVLRRRGRPTLRSFAITCLAEAVAVIVPYALGDRIAVAAMTLQPLGDLSFALQTAAWFALTSLVVLPAAVIAGYQFPLLIALCGSGRRDVGREVGQVYAWNTAGTIAGSIAGGFGLLPLLSAPGAWKLAAVLLLAFAAVAWVLDPRPGRDRPGRDRPWQLALPLAAAVLGLVLLTAPGPSAVWRHTPIGAGTMPHEFAGPNDVRRMSHAVRRAIVWEEDGRESSVAIHALDEVTLLVNGKADGSALRDAPTQVMSGLVGAVLHPDPRRALVIGLGTGSSAGWLAEVESIEHVDVVELEPAVFEAARQCAPVNHNALVHPKVRIWIGDGREHMLTADESYDLIFSEPSNPYRAGIASLFTAEFYQAAAGRLGEGGLFLQWLQAYHIDSQVVRTVLATLAAVFSDVEVWQVHNGDLLLVASRTPIDHDLVRIWQRTRSEPIRGALDRVLGVEGAEGFYTGFLSSADLARAVAREENGRLNTDDLPVIEFGFARGVGRDLEFRPDRLAALASRRGEQLPALHNGRLDWRRVLEQRSARNAKWNITTDYPRTGDHAFDHRVAARNAYVIGDLEATLRRWRSQELGPTHPIDLLIVAEALADAGDAEALELAGDLEAAGRGTEASAVRARFYFRTGEEAEARATLAAVFVAAREDPWVHRPALERSLQLAIAMTRDEPADGHDFWDALSAPFAVRLLDETRRRVRLAIAEMTDPGVLCADALAPFEPHIPWEEDFLRQRLECYREASHPLAERARAELEAFLGNTPPRLAGSAAL